MSCLNSTGACGAEWGGCLLDPVEVFVERCMTGPQLHAQAGLHSQEVCCVTDVVVGGEVIIYL